MKNSNYLYFNTNQSQYQEQQKLLKGQIWFMELLIFHIKNWPTYLVLNKLDCNLITMEQKHNENNLYCQRDKHD